MKSYKMKQKGFTLVEIAIVVAIGALLLIGLSQAPRIIAGNKANAEISELPGLVTSIQKIYANQASLTGVTLAQVIALNGFDPARVISPTVANNRWGGLITLAVATTNTAGDSMDIISAGVPALECTNLVPAVEGRFSSIIVNGTNVKLAGNALNMANLAIGCAVTPTTNITYRFMK